MASYTTTITPRLRVARNSLNYDRSVSQIATATESPSRLPEISQLVDLNLNEMAPSETSEQSSTSTVPGPSTSTRSENPAAVLRALLSRLPAESRSPLPPSPSQQYLSERESDYDMDLTEPAHAARSMVQENLKDIFSKARRDPGDTPQKARTRRDSNTASEANLNSTPNIGRDDDAGKRRSNDEELDNANGFSQRPPARFKNSPQPVTLEFLRERFSDSRLSHGSVGDAEHPPSIHDFSNYDAAISPELNSFQTNIPMATSTPQQSLRMSFNSQFQSNLLDQDTEMHHAIDELDSYEGSSANRPISPPPIIRKRSTSQLEHLTSITSNSLEDSNKTPTNRVELRPPSLGSPRSNDASSDRRDYDGILELGHQQIKGGVQFSPGYGHSHRSTLDEPTPRAGNRGQSSRYRPSTPSRDDLRRPDNPPSDSTTPPGSPPFVNIQSEQCPQTSSFPASFVEDRPYDNVENTSRTERKSDSSRHTWNTPFATRPQTSPPISPSRLISNSFRSLNQLKADNHLQSERPDSMAEFSNLAPSKEESYLLTSPSHSSPSGSNLGRTSSLQAIDSTYHHDDPNLRRRLRSLSPLPSSSKADLKSPNMSNITRSRFDKLPSNRKHITSSHDWASSTQDLSVKSTYPQPTRASSPWNSRLDSNEEESDKTKEIDLSTFENKTPTMKDVPPDVSDFHGAAEHPAAPPSRTSSRLSNVPIMPNVLLKEPASPSKPYKEILLSPSTPSRRTPKNIRKAHQSSSPTEGPPDLPTPSSSDESDRTPWDYAVTSKPNINIGSNASWLPTPRPPGGWLQTPMPSRTRPGVSVRNVDDYSTLGHDESDTDDDLESKTPLRAVNATSNKTPRPPGAWQTPAPVSKSVYPASSERRDPEATQDLLTPAPSLSKGSFLDPKTPYVPGGWTATPAARKSILKVRFNQGAEALSTDNGLAVRPRNNHTSDEYATKQTPTEDSSSTALSLSRTPRHTQVSNIRVLDAYGQEVADDLNTQRSTLSRNALRVVDSMGREVREPGKIGEDEDIDKDEDNPPSSRTELLSRIRRGLDNLVEDIDEIDRENDARVKDETRIEELDALSMQARKNRERLLGQATRLQPKHDRLESNTILSGPKPRPSNRRLYVIMLLVQILLGLIMYRLSIHRARELFLNSYYDPFNPDLYLYIFKYDTSFQLSNADFSRNSERSFGDALLQGGKAFAVCLRLFGDLKSYFFKLWAIEASSLHTTTWAPT